MATLRHLQQIAVVLLLLAWTTPVRAQEVDAETRAFLKKHVPSALALLKQIEREGDKEDLAEALEWFDEIRTEYSEALEEDDKKQAELEIAFAENEVAIELVKRQFVEEEIGEAEAERRVRALLKKQLALEFRADRAELRALREEAKELEEEIREREENAEEEIEERFRELVEELEEGEEDEDEGEEDEELSGPVYTPSSTNAPDPDAALVGVAFDFDKHIAPTLERYCLDCHDSANAKGDIDLEVALAQRPFVRNLSLWENVAERVRGGDMPPEKKPQPSAEERRRIRAWLARDVDGFDYATVRNPGHVPARRLTREEYNRTIRDLVGLDLRPADDFPMDFSGTSGFSNSANTLFLQTAHLDRYVTTAEGVIDTVRENAEAWSKLAGADSSSAALAAFLKRAYRRPPTASELADALGRHRAAKRVGKSDAAALAEAFKFVLISPQFLLRVETAGAAGKDQPVAGYDLASRLSYFLWTSMPDDQLLTAAGSGGLSDPVRRRAQVERMLADPRSIALGEIFAAEWLGTDDLGPRIRKDPIDNPWCTESLMAAMRDETALFFHSLVLDNAPVARLLDADYTFLNAELARFYRVDGVEGESMRRVRLETARRGGLFGHAAALAVTSFPDRTSPVVRGTWILGTLLGTPPPPPPPDVPEIDVEGRGRRAATTLRRKLEIHRESKRCAGCHAQIDPLGFALESYAEFGQWRSGVDNRGSLPNGAQFRGPAGLKQALIDTRLDDLGKQVTRKMLAYALGRQLEYYDEAVVREIAAKLKPSGYPLRQLVIEIANSYPFTTRRLPAPAANQ